jgi:hypothetical protein
MTDVQFTYPPKEWERLAYLLGKAIPADAKTRRMIKGPLERTLCEIELTFLIQSMAFGLPPKNEFERRVRESLAEAIDFEAGHLSLALKKTRRGRPRKNDSGAILRFIFDRFVGDGMKLQAVFKEASVKFGKHERNIRKVYQKRRETFAFGNGE